MATDCTSPEVDSKWKQSFRRRLLAWYAKHERDLPWRKSQDPYRVWVSEVMLQQTQVETVKPYFQRFLKAFPTVKNLAAAEESQVLRLWEGLGYYRRARGLHAAAKQIVAEHGGQFPQDVVTMQSLPGIGRYTAGAIASIAFNQREPILEANTIRLLARLLAYPDDPTKSAGQRLLWATAEEILPSTNVSRFNQALMELGSLVCTPTQPKCEECPVSRHCGAYQNGLQDELPRAAAKLKFTDVHEAAVVVRKNGQVIVRQCGTGERWAGLWDFPRFAIESEGPLFVEEELIKKVCQQTGVTAKPGALLTTMKHGVTRYRITLDCYSAQFVSGRLKRHTRWIRPAELADLPLSTTGRKLANRIEKSVSKN
ncbi:A/G-specific adenine glycosylase [Bythopirellula polymerisocia]|nr:A/G-specific adenine glycosylase [Bythopirellula polymerisocia]